MSFDLEHKEVEETISPYVVERWHSDDPQFRKRYEKQERKWRLNLLKRQLFGWLPSLKRTPDFTKKKYDRIWSNYPLPETAPATAEKPKLRLATWNGDGMLIGRHGLYRIRLLLAARIIRTLNPRNVLEIGFGSGISLFSLAAMLPDIQFTGVELSSSGVEHASSLIAEPELPPQFVDFCPEPDADLSAHRRVEVHQGTAVDLPFEAGSFDLVFTHQALEQMERVRHAALSEIARVARNDVLLIEPFADANDTPLRQSYVRANEYFSLPVAGLKDFGIEPVFSTRAFPQKTGLGIALVHGPRAGSLSRDDNPPRK